VRLYVRVNQEPCVSLADFPTRHYLSVNALEKGSLMNTIFQILSLFLDIAWFFILAHVIMSWLISFQVLNLHQQFVAQVWQMLNQILHPIYSRIRRFLPQMSGIDLAPLVALVAIMVLRIILRNAAIAAY